MSNIKLISYNIWYHPHKRLKRCDHLISLILMKDPDIICLQEVTIPVKQRLLQAIGSKYYSVDDMLEYGTHRRYGNMILSKIPIIKHEIYDLQTKMERKFLMAFLGNNIIIGCIHFDSGDNEITRRSQFNFVTDLCKIYPNVILTGDFNMKSSESSLSNYFYTFDNVDTYDTKTNVMISHEPYLPQPFDRVMIRGFNLINFELIGNIPIDLDYTYISDHYGLFFSIN